MNENFNFASSGMVHVDSYTRSNGTFVDEYWRRRPDSMSTSIVPQNGGSAWDKILDIFPNIVDYDRNGVLKKIFTQNCNSPPFVPEPDEGGPRTIFVPEHRDEQIMSAGFLGGAGELFPNGLEVIKNAVIKAGEIAAEAAKKVGETVADTVQNVGNVFADSPKALILDTTREAIQAKIEMTKYIGAVFETAESGVLDTIKEALSKIDKDEIAVILAKAVKDFGNIAKKYPELLEAYENLQKMRVNAVLYRSLERQQISDKAKEAKNGAVIAAKDFANEIKHLTTGSLPALEKMSRTNSATPNTSGFLTNIPELNNTNLPNSSTLHKFRVPSMLDIKTPTADFWANRYYTDIEPLQNRVNVSNFSGKVYKTPAQVAKEMEGYRYLGADIQGYISKNVDIPVFKYADEYYRIALNGVKDVGETNVAYKLYELPDKELVQFIMQHYKVSENIDVVTPTFESEIRNEILNSPYFMDGLKAAVDKIGIKNMPKNTSIEFPKVYTTRDLDLYATFHFAEIYDPYYDSYGNLHFILVDYYDFARTKADILSEIFINNAYVQQEFGMMKNYVIIIPMILKT